MLWCLQKHQDAFASAFGFFILGFDIISKYGAGIEYQFFGVTDPVVWFFKVINNLLMCKTRVDVFHSSSPLQAMQLPLLEVA